MVDIRAVIDRMDAQDGPTVRWIAWFGEGGGLHLPVSEPMASEAD